jgi:hypothetical protein
VGHKPERSIELPSAEHLGLSAQRQGYLLALVLLVGSYYISWSFAVLPVWASLISVYILIDNLRR